MHAHREACRVHHDEHVLEAAILLPNQMTDCATVIVDLRNATLLHSYARPDDWRKWLSAADASDIDSTRGMKFENSGLMYQAAVEGVGIAIAQAVLFRQDLRSGVLVAPFALTIPAERTYYLIGPVWAEPRRLAVFREWVLKESRSDND
ncbi:MAG: LysR substrate-binding domain-containing protein [Paraburkholderia sp.]